MLDTLDWFNTGYLVLVIFISVLYRVFSMIPILIGLIVATIIYKHYLGKFNFQDIQKGSIVSHVTFILLWLSISFGLGTLNTVWIYLQKFVLLIGGLGGLYGFYYIYYWITYTSLVKSIINWFNNIPDKLTQLKIISSIIALFSSLPILYNATRIFIPTLLSLFYSPIALTVFNIILTIGSYFVYKSFSLDPNTNTSGLHILWGLLTLILYSGSYFLYKNTALSTILNGLKYLLFGVIGIVIVIGIIMLLWTILSKPIVWKIIGYLLLSIIAISILKKLYGYLPDSIKQKIAYLFALLIGYSTQFINDTKKISIMVWAFVLIEIFVLLFMISPYRVEFNQGTVIQGSPVSLSKLTNTNLQKDNSTYVYGISFSLKLNSQPPDYSPSSTVFTSILNYSNVPHISYNSSLKCLRVTMKQQDEKTRVICDIDVPLQKLFNIYIGYEHGVIDVFYNGKLVKSRGNIIPYLTPTTMTLGMNDGIDGEISKVRFFIEPLTHQKIQRLSFLK